MLEKLVKAHTRGSKECKDLTCESKDMAPQSWQYLGQA